MMKKLSGCLSLLLIALVPFLDACNRAQPEIQVTDGLESINGTEIYYKRMGAGEPVVVVHGGPVLEHGYLVPWLKPLAENFELIYFDQRLSGRSSADVDSTEVRMDEFVGDIEGLRTAFNLGKIHVVGHSWGGLLAMNYAVKYPSNIRSLVLLNSMPASSELWNKEEQILAQRISAEDSAKRREIINSDLFKNNPPEAIEQLLVLSFRNQFQDPSLADSLDFYIPDDYTTRSRLFGHIMADISTYDLHPELSSLEVPVLLIYGSLEPAASMSGPELRKSIPNSDLVIIKNTGHFPFVEKPELVISELEYFFNAN